MSVNKTMYEIPNPVTGTKAKSNLFVNVRCSGCGDNFLTTMDSSDQICENCEKVRAIATTQAQIGNANG